MNKRAFESLREKKNLEEANMLMDWDNLITLIQDCPMIPQPP